MPDGPDVYGLFAKLFLDLGETSFMFGGMQMRTRLQICAGLGVGRPSRASCDVPPPAPDVFAFPSGLLPGCPDRVEAGGFCFSPAPRRDKGGQKGCPSAHQRTRVSRRLGDNSEGAQRGVTPLLPPGARPGSPALLRRGFLATPPQQRGRIPRQHGWSAYGVVAPTSISMLPPRSCSGTVATPTPLRVSAATDFKAPPPPCPSSPTLPPGVRPSTRPNRIPGGGGTSWAVDNLFADCPPNEGVPAPMVALRSASGA